MDSEAKDMKGQGIYVGSKVSDGMCAGTVYAVHESQVWFIAEGTIGKRVRGKVFNKPENLLVISPEVWKRCMGKESPCC